MTTSPSVWRVVAPACAVLEVALAGPLARAASAQRVTGTLDAGAATVAYDDFLRSAAMTVSPTLRMDAPRSLVVARGAFSVYESGRRAVQGVLGGSVFSPAWRNTRLEVTGTAGATWYDEFAPVSNVVGETLLHYTTGDAGSWAGGGIGRVHDGLRDRRVLRGNVGGWVRQNRTTVTATITPVAVGEWKYVDALGGLRWTAARVEVTGTAGVRRGERLSGVTGWVEGAGTVWVFSRVALVAGAGSYPADLAQGIPGGHYGALALRVAMRPQFATGPLRPSDQALYQAVARTLPGVIPTADRFGIARLGEGRHTIRIFAPGAQRVELMGDFTAWEPIEMAPGRGGYWQATVRLDAGTHRINVRIDGGEWKAPPGLVTVGDDFGGEVGVFVIQ